MKAPVVIVLDDADLLDPGLARAVVGGLAGRYDGRVLVVAAARPGSELVAGLVKEAGPDLAGRICRAEVDPGMDYRDRVDLVRELLPDMPAQAVEQVARRTATFGEVFAVAATDKVAALDPGAGAGDTTPEARCTSRRVAVPLPLLAYERAGCASAGICDASSCAGQSAGCSFDGS